MQGPKGDRGVSSYDQVPSGQTVRGYFLYNETSSTADFDVLSYAPFGAFGALSSDADSVQFAPETFSLTTEDDATCTGTVAAPTAPAGKVCLYLTSSANVVSATGFPISAFAGPKPGFRVEITGTADNANVLLGAVWAYTAP